MYEPLAFIQAPVRSGVHQVRPEPNDQMAPSPIVNGVATENPGYQTPEVKAKTHSIRRSLLGGLFRRDNVSYSKRSSQISFRSILRKITHDLGFSHISH